MGIQTTWIPQNMQVIKCMKMHSSIWHTNTTPTLADYPVWAYTSNSDSVVFISDSGLYDQNVIAWCRASVPQPPRPGNDVEERFWELRRSSHTIGWLPSDWFKAGYSYGTRERDTDDGDISTNNWRDEIEPYESAYDERT